MQPEELAQYIRSSGQWNGEPIVLLVCHAGADTTSASPAYRLARELGTEVYAPKTYVWLVDGGLYYVYNTELDVGDPNLEQEIQKTMWNKFTWRGVEPW